MELKEEQHLAECVTAQDLNGPQHRHQVAARGAWLEDKSTLMQEMAKLQQVVDKYENSNTMIGERPPQASALAQGPPFAARDGQG